MNERPKPKPTGTPCGYLQWVEEEQAARRQERITATIFGLAPILFAAAMLAAGLWGS